MSIQKSKSIDDLSETVAILRGVPVLVSVVELIEIPFKSVMWTMVKWALASIPAALIFAIIFWSALFLLAMIAAMAGTPIDQILHWFNPTAR
jgi:hypothetical protein